MLQGTSYVANFTNLSSSTAYLTAFQIYGTPCPVTDHISIAYSDPTSIAAYGVNPGNNGYVLEIDNDYIQTQDNATTLAYALVEEFKTAGQRYLAYPLANPAIQLGDLLAVTNSDTGITTNMYVTGRTVTLGVGELTYALNSNSAPFCDTSRSAHRSSAELTRSHLKREADCEWLPMGCDDRSRHG